MSKMLNLMMAVALSTAAGSAMASTVTTNWGTLLPETSASTNGKLVAGNLYDFLFTYGGTSAAEANATAIDVSGGITSATLTDTTTSTSYSYSLSTMGSYYYWLVSLLSGHNYKLELTGTGAYSAGVTIGSEVPLPAAGLLFGTALLGAAGLGRKKRETVQADAVAA